MIVITGTEGFIGSVLVDRLITRGYRDIVCVDLEGKARNNYLGEFPFLKNIDHTELYRFIQKNHHFVEFVFHLGACSDTTLSDKTVFDTLNVAYSKMLWESCTMYGIPLVYASSAATYGDGSMGYSDDDALLPHLKPLNLYGQSKQEFDLWALAQNKKPQFWSGLKFFNVYGRNEYHKETMASVVMHAFNQIKKQGYVNLFRSHRDDVRDGEQSRDFIYVDDVCEVMIFFMEKMPQTGLFNVGTGINRTFADLVESTFSALGLKSDIRYVDTPMKLRKQYQYYTRADVSKLRAAGYKERFTSLEEGVADYVKNYLSVASKMAV